MYMPKSVRIDKYLWAVRVYKTRSIATDACRKGKVSVDGMPAKASRTVSSGDIIRVRKMPVIYTYQVLDPIEKRVGTKIVDKHVKDLTPEEELLKLTMQDDFFVKREKGSGRPTKKERRLLDDIRGENP
jgi:ribosome-associated heat shock protein Hsp15